MSSNSQQAVIFLRLHWVYAARFCWGGAAGAPSVSIAQQLPHVSSEPAPAGFTRDPPLARARPWTTLVGFLGECVFCPLLRARKTLHCRSWERGVSNQERTNPAATQVSEEGVAETKHPGLTTASIPFSPCAACGEEVEAGARQEGGFRMLLVLTACLVIIGNKLIFPMIILPMTVIEEQPPLPCLNPWAWHHIFSPLLWRGSERTAVWCLATCWC